MWQSRSTIWNSLGPPHGCVLNRFAKDISIVSNVSSAFSVIVCGWDIKKALQAVGGKLYKRCQLNMSDTALINYFMGTDLVPL